MVRDESAQPLLFHLLQEMECLVPLQMKEMGQHASAFREGNESPASGFDRMALKEGKCLTVCNTGSGGFGFITCGGV